MPAKLVLKTVLVFGLVLSAFAEEDTKPIELKVLKTSIGRVGRRNRGLAGGPECACDQVQRRGNESPIRRLLDRI